MASEININSSISVQSSRSSGINKVDPATGVKLLPQDGNELPQSEKNSETKPEHIEDAVREINQHEQFISRELQFSIDEDSGHTVIKVIDSTTNETIRQIPNEEVLKVARNLSEGANLEIFSAYS